MVGSVAAAGTRHRGRSRRFGSGASTIGLVALAAGLLAVAVHPGAVPPVSAGAFVAAATSSPVCNPASVSPSAVSIPAPNPTGSAQVNGTVVVAYEIAVLNYTTSLGKITVYMPSVFGSFALLPSGTLQAYIGPKVVNISSTGWTDANSTGTTTTKTLTAGVNFSTTGTARLSSQKIAVMAGASYAGSLTLEFRWQWALVAAPGGLPVYSAWTTPSTSAASPSLPSIFYPAPYVSLVGTGNWPAPIGSNYSVRLGGAVASTSFRMVLEWPSNGTEIRSTVENTTSGITVFPGWVLLSPSGAGQLGPGTYLIHVHDACGAITHSFSVGTTNESVLCGAHTLSPSAISIPAPNPTHSLKSKSTVQVYYQVQIVNYTSSLGKVTVYLPSSKGVFPILPSGTLNVSVASKNLTLSSGGWSSQLSGTYTTTGTLAFNTSQVAHFSTSKLAVMSTGSYNGKVTLQVQWKWKISGQDGSWSKPSYSYSSPYLPSIFYPAPYTPVLATSPTAIAGTNYTVELGGAVAHTMFRMVVEYPSNGTELRHTDEYTSPNATTFNATILLSSMTTQQPLAPGSYLVHVHDVCDAITHSISITVTASGNGSNQGLWAGGAPVAASPGTSHSAMPGATVPTMARVAATPARRAAL